MIIVTGGAGFIGSNLIEGLNKIGIKDIILVDDVKTANRKNIKNLIYKKQYSIKELIRRINKNQIGNIDCIFHQGACSNTLESRVDYILENNFYYSKKLLDFSIKKNIKFIYASSASVYGRSIDTSEKIENENPLNLYAISKLLFDNYVRSKLNSKNQITGLRYFNVYGKNESHKNNMASVIFHFSEQLKNTNEVKIFGNSLGYKNGEHKRDFIHVDDVISVNLWFLKVKKSGIFNVGTGKAVSFNKVAKILSKDFTKSKISYIPFPKKLLKFYQPYTKAKINSLKTIGYKKKFLNYKEGVSKYFYEN